MQRIGCPGNGTRESAVLYPCTIEHHLYGLRLCHGQTLVTFLSNLYNMVDGPVWFIQFIGMLCFLLLARLGPYPLDLV